MRTMILGTGIAFGLAAFSAGCIVTAEPATYGTVVYDEPPPDQRVYIYDPGYPPGCYYYGDDVYYEGRAYRRDVFVDRVVNVNLRESRYLNVEENRNYASNYVARDKGRYQNMHPGYRPSPGPRPGDRGGGRGDDRPENRNGRE